MTRAAPQAGFTLLELLVVLAIVALGSAGVGLALRDGTQDRLAREATRLAATLDAARAQAQVAAVPLRWRPLPGGFRFEGMAVVLDTADGAAALRWLDPDTQAQVEGAASAGVSASSEAATVLLGPEPMIGPQAVWLRSRRQPDQRVRLATDGLRPFAITPETP
ncbi:MAG: hypothetical protein Fur007_00560 [Rhodoferax sp.]